MLFNLTELTLDGVPTPLKREETEYLYDALLDNLYMGHAQELKWKETEYEFDPISIQGLKQVAEIEHQAMAQMGNPPPTERAP